MNQGIRVLHIIDSLGLGGAQIYLKNLFEAQKEQKDIFVFSLRNKDVNIDIGHKNIVRFSSNKKYSLEPLFDLKKIIKQNDITVLHCHLFRAQVFGFLIKMFWYRDIKLVFHEHGEIFQGHFIYNVFLTFSRRLVDVWIAVSRITKQEILINTSVDPKDIVVIYNFVRPEELERVSRGDLVQAARTSFNIQGEQYVIGFAGRLSAEKGCKCLIEALPLIKGPFKVLIAGDGSLKDELKSLASALGMADKVVFLGYVKNMREFYLTLDVLVVPSMMESFGLSAVEAQRIGVPVIASNVGGLAEILHNEVDSLLFEANSSKALSSQIQGLKEDPGLRALLISNGIINADKFDIKTHVESLVGLYATI